MKWTPSGKRILYLEDEAIIALDTAEMLKDIGFDTIDLCHSLEMAEAAIGAARPDVALLDVNLAHGRTSIELGNRLLEDGVPVIYATGYSSASLPVDPRACILEKPVAAEALDRTLRSVAAC